MTNIYKAEDNNPGIVNLYHFRNDNSRSTLWCSKIELVLLKTKIFSL